MSSEPKTMNINNGGIPYLYGVVSFCHSILYIRPKLDGRVLLSLSAKHCLGITLNLCTFGAFSLDMRYFSVHFRVTNKLRNKYKLQRNIYNLVS